MSAHAYDAEYDDRADDLRAWHAEDGPADGAALLDDVLSTFQRYVVFPDLHSAVGVALWTAATHALPAFECAPRLVITSPEKRCGKSRLLDIIAGTCHEPLMSVNATVAAIYRCIGNTHPPTLLIDEADTLFSSKRVAEQHEDLRAFVNAGHQRGRPALRCVGPHQVPTEFPTFAMVALAGIGSMPDTITDRAVNVTLRRRTRDERVSQFRTRRDGPRLAALRGRLAAWCAAQLDALADAEPVMPVEDRAADTWEPLVAVADVAGGRWPRLAREACKALVDAADAAGEDQSLAVKLLFDIRQIFDDKGVPFLASTELVAELRRLEDSPWDGFDLTPSKLAHRLRQFGIKPQRIGHDAVRGYKLESLHDSFDRYTRQQPSACVAAQVNPQKDADGSQAADGLTRQRENIRQHEIAGQVPFRQVLTGADDPAAKNGFAPPGFVPPRGPDRCRECGFHVPTQGHRDGCQQTIGEVGQATPDVLPDRLDSHENTACTVCGRPVSAGQGDTHLSCVGRARNGAEADERSRAGLCRDCGQRPPAAGRTRCDQCHRIHEHDMGLHDR